MPCVSLMHRKIYCETIAPRIAARKLCRATEKATLRAARKAAKKLARSSSSAPVPQASNAPQYPGEPSVEAQPTTVHNLALHQLRTDLAAMVDSQSHAPKVEYISSVLQEFREGVEVKILHTKHRLSVDNPFAVNAAFTSWSATRVNGLGDGRVDFLRPSAGQRAEEKVREARNESQGVRAKSRASLLLFRGDARESERSEDGPERHRVEEKQIAHPVGFLRRRPTRTELINAESSLGRTLFGPIPAGHRREFFHDRNNVWIWYEGWTEPNHKAHQITIRYEVRPTGVFKKLGAGNYVELVDGELENFRRAAHAYLYLIKRNLYHLA